MLNKRPIITLLVLGGLIAGLVFFGQSNSFAWLGRIFRSALNPVATVIYRLGSSFKSEEAISLEELKNKVEVLTTENQRLLVDNTRLLTLEDENRRLRDYLVFAQSRQLSLQMAEVISRGLAEDSWQKQRVITLNQGSDQGVKIGLPIVSSEGVLLGKIIAVKNNLAEACLLYSSDCRLAVGLAGQGKTIGLAQGDLGLNITIEFIPQDQAISEGQIIVTSGLEADMPPGLLIGKVSKVIKQNNELWQSAIIEPAADFEDLRFVAILK